MKPVTLNSPSQPRASTPPNNAIFNFGFRIFFFSASLFAIASMALWTASYSLGHNVATGALPPAWWHGHEMVFGYSMAVVAGFLLTAVQNWTGVAMPKGTPLALIWLPWVLARLIFALWPAWQLIAEGLDMLFVSLLTLVVGRAVFAVRQWRQAGILSKLILMLTANILFFGESIGVLASGHYWGLYLGVFILVSLVLTVGRRVTPFFIERGVGYEVKLKNSPLKDRLSMLSLLAFFIVEIFTTQHTLACLLALAAAFVQGWRLTGWYTHGIWKKPLLWSLYLAFVAIVIGLLLYFLRLFLPISAQLAMHGLAVGGIGIVTLSMIGRVSLGHTGRNIHQPSRGLVAALFLIFATFIFRTLFPAILPEHYLVWIIHSQVTWMLAFALLLAVNLKIWFTPRPDGQPG